MIDQPEPSCDVLLHQNEGHAIPTEIHVREAASWLPAADYHVDTIADAYAEFALRIVGAG